MNFINLRKHDQKRDTAPENVEPDETAEDDDVQEQEPEGRPLGLLPALYRGVRGWCTWCSVRIGVGPTYAVHAVALWAASRYNAWVTFGVTGAFVLVVGLFTPREPFDRIAARLDAYDEAREAARAAGPDEPDEGAPEEPPADPLPALMWRLIGEAPGVHLKTLTEVLAEAATKKNQEPPSKADVEAALQARGIPLRPSVRDVREKVNKGVHRADLKAWQTALSSPESAAPVGP